MQYRFFSFVLSLPLFIFSFCSLGFSVTSSPLEEIDTLSVKRIQNEIISKVIEINKNEFTLLLSPRPYWALERTLASLERSSGERKPVKISGLPSGASPVILDLGYSGIEGEILVADHGTHRFYAIDPKGQIKWSKWVQAPAFSPRSIVGGELGDIFVAGCLAIREYLDLGCKLIHHFGPKGKAYKASFFETDTLAVKNQLFGLEQHFVDGNAKGQIVLLDSAIPKLQMRTGSNQGTKVYLIASDKIESIPLQRPTNGPPNAQRFWMMNGLALLEDEVVIGYTSPFAAKHYIAVFSLNTGKQILKDQEVSGPIVGRSAIHSCFWISQQTRDVNQLHCMKLNKAKSKQ